MTLSAELIKDLDDALVDVGQDIVLQRLATDDAGVETVAYQAECRASVRAHSPQSLDGSFDEAAATAVVLSPTDLVREGWPLRDGLPVPVKDDRLMIAGRANNVETVSPIQVGGTLVRVNLTCRE